MRPLAPVCDRAVFAFLHFLYFLNILYFRLYVENFSLCSSLVRLLFSKQSSPSRQFCPLRPLSKRKCRRRPPNPPRFRTIFPEFGCSIRLNPRQESPA